MSNKEDMGQLERPTATARCPSRTGVHPTTYRHLEAAALFIPAAEASFGQTKVCLSPQRLRASGIRYVWV